jgi:hypothetical protein
MLGWGVVLLTVVDGVMLSFDPQYEPSHNGDKNNDDNKRAYGPVIPIISGAIAYTEKFIEAHEKLLIVLSTIAIAWFTATLWRATSGLQTLATKQTKDMRTSLRIAARAANAARKSAKASEDTVESMKLTAERQLRAHVFFNGGMMSNVADPLPIHIAPQANPAAITYPNIGPKVFIEIKNFGQTPAYRVTHWAHIHFEQFPLGRVRLPKRKQVLGPVRSITSSMILGPGAAANKNLSMPERLTDEEIARLRNGTAAIYVYGVILYRDEFGKRRWSTYRYMHIEVGGHIGISTTLVSYGEGNNAR